MAKPIESIYVARNVEDTRTEASYDLLVRSLGEFGVERVVDIDLADTMVIIGGDGSFLKQIREHEFPNIPVTGVGSGTLNYYMSTPNNKDCIDYMVRNLAEGDYTINKLPLMELTDRNRTIGKYAINDLVIKSEGFQAFKAGLEINGTEFEHFIGGGLIFATPQGSSAEAVANGGSFIREGLPVWTMVPVAKHQSKEYHSLIAPIVLGENDTVEVDVKEVEWRPFIVGTDGEMVDWPDDAGKLIVQLARDKWIDRIRLNNNTYLEDISKIFRGKR